MAKSKSKAKAEAKPAESETDPTPAQKPKAKAKRTKREPVPDAFLEMLAGLIEGALAEREWTPYKLAREARVDYSSVYRFLTAKKAVSLATLAKCLDAMSLTLKAVPRDSA
jgi:DNA-binding phage protein